MNIVKCSICGKDCDVVDKNTRIGLNGPGHEKCVLEQIKGFVDNKIKKLN